MTKSSGWKVRLAEEKFWREKAVYHMERAVSWNCSEERGGRVMQKASNHRDSSANTEVRETLEKLTQIRAYCKAYVRVHETRCLDPGEALSLLNADEAGGLWPAKPRDGHNRATRHGLVPGWGRHSVIQRDFGSDRVLDGSGTNDEGVNTLANCPEALTTKPYRQGRLSKWRLCDK